MTDTAAYADTVFGLFWLLGYQLSPRLADIGDARFWRINKTADYGALNGLARNRINIDLVTQNWEDMLRSKREPSPTFPAFEADDDTAARVLIGGRGDDGCRLVRGF